MFANGKLRLLTTAECNLDCFYCHNEGQGSEHGFIEVELVRWLGDVAMRYGARARSITVSGGEALLHPKLLQIVEECTRFGDDVNVISNGILASRETMRSLSNAGLSSFRFGIDSLNPYKTRPSKGKLVAPFIFEEKIADAREAGLAVEANVVITKFNARELGDILRFAVDHQLPIKFFEQVDVVASRASDGRVGVRRGIPHVPVDEVFAAFHAEFGSKIQRSPSDSILVDEEFLVEGISFKYCRYLCLRDECYKTGTRLDPLGLVFNCMSNRGLDRVSSRMSTQEGFSTLVRAAGRPCRDEECGSTC